MDLGNAPEMAGEKGFKLVKSQSNIVIIYFKRNLFNWGVAKVNKTILYDLKEL